MRTFLVMSVCAAGLCGCAQSIDAPLSPTFGQAVASMNAQIIPAPVSDLPPPGSGAVAAAAVARYEKGEVKPPLAQGTSSTTLTLVPYGAK